MTGFIKNLLVLTVIVLVAVAGYYIYSTQQIGQLDIDPFNSIEAEVLANTQVFIQRRAVLQAVDLSTELYNDPQFRSLVTYTEPVEPVPVGRDNPFLEADNREDLVRDTATPTFDN